MIKPYRDRAEAGRFLARKLMNVLPLRFDKPARITPDVSPACPCTLRPGIPRYPSRPGTQSVRRLGRACSNQRRRLGRAGLGDPRGRGAPDSPRGGRLAERGEMKSPRSPTRTEGSKIRGQKRRSFPDFDGCPQIRSPRAVLFGGEFEDAKRWPVEEGPPHQGERDVVDRDAGGGATLRGSVVGVSVDDARHRIAVQGLSWFGGATGMSSSGPSTRPGTGLKCPSRTGWRRHSATIGSST
jgi:hypothetical protein